MIMHHEGELLRMEEFVRKIEKLVKTKTAMKKAHALYEENNVVSFEVDSHMSPEVHYVFAMVKDTAYNQVDLSIRKSDFKVIISRCTCDKFNEKNIPCQHIGAALLKYVAQVLPKYTPQEVQVLDDTFVKSVLSSLRSDTVHHLLAESKNMKATMNYQLQFFDYEYMGVSFKVGNEKYYVIKDSDQLFSMMEQHQQKKYGKDLDLYHHLASFDEATQQVLTFLMNVQDDHLRIQKERKSTSSKHFYLAKQNITQFIALLEEYACNYGFHDIEDVELLKENPQIEVHIKKVNQAYRIHLEESKVEYCYNGSELYYYNSSILYESSGETTRRLYLFLSLFQQQKEITVSFPLLQEFYVSFLEPLSKELKVSGEKLEECKPIPFSAKILLDAIGTNKLSAKLLFVYGEFEINSILKNPYEIARNYEAELRIILLIKKYFKFIDENNGIFILDHSIDLLYEFFKFGFEELSQYATIYSSDKVKNIKIKDQISMSVGVKINSDLLEIDLKTDDFPMDELSMILQAYREHKKYYRMRNGSFLHLDETGLNELSMFIDTLNIKPKELESGSLKTSSYRALSLDHTLQSASNLKIERDSNFRELVSDLHNVKDSLYEVPQGLKDILRNYQKEGYRWLKTMAHYGFGGILADDMGIGKTIQVITLLEDARLQGSTLPSIVICPSSLLLNWYNEIQKFAPSLRVGVIHGSAEVRGAMIASTQEFDVFITSYDYLKRDIEQFENTTFLYQILDEAQYIKNQTTKNAQTVKLVNAKHRFALTGTPIENSLAEIWSIFDYLMPDYLFSYTYFKKQFEVGIVKYEDAQALQSLRKMVEPFILRRVKKDVLKELPDKIETTLYLELEEETQKLYEANILAMKTDLLKQQAQGIENKILVLSMLTKLRQICCDPRLIYDNIHTPSIKVQAVMDIVANAKESNKKVLIFSQFTSVFKLLKQEFAQEQIAYYTLTGKTSKEERHRLVNEFNVDDTNVFLISLKAGGTGLNLTGAEVVIHFDPWWNLSAQNQATDRAYRLGQQNNVQVYKLICKDTIEEKILQLQNLKKDLADSIIFENENLISKMSINDIMELF